MPCASFSICQMGKSLKKFLTKSIVKKDLKTKLAVADAKLGGVIKVSGGAHTLVYCFGDFYV